VTSRKRKVNKKQKKVLLFHHCSTIYSSLLCLRNVHFHCICSSYIPYHGSLPQLPRRHCSGHCCCPGCWALLRLRSSLESPPPNQRASPVRRAPRFLFARATARNSLQGCARPKRAQVKSKHAMSTITRTKRREQPRQKELPNNMSQRGVY